MFIDAIPMCAVLPGHRIFLRITVVTALALIGGLSAGLNCVDAPSDAERRSGQDLFSLIIQQLPPDSAIREDAEFAFRQVVGRSPEPPTE